MASFCVPIETKPVVVVGTSHSSTKFKKQWLCFHSNKFMNNVNAREDAIANNLVAYSNKSIMPVKGNFISHLDQQHLKNCLTRLILYVRTHVLYLILDRYIG